MPPRIKKKVSRKELLKTDEIALTLEEKVWEWVKANQKTVVIAAAAILIVAAVVFGVRKYGAYKEAQAMALYGQAQAGGAPKPEDVPKVLQRLAAVAERYPNTKAARYAQLERANLLYNQGRYAEAAKVYEDALGRFKAGDDLEALAKQGLALCRLSLGDLAGAQKLFQEMAAGKLGAGTAQVYLGLIYERQGNLKEAVAAYRQAAQQAQGPEAALARDRLEFISERQAGGA